MGIAGTGRRRSSAWHASGHPAEVMHKDKSGVTSRAARWASHQGSWDVVDRGVHQLPHAGQEEYCSMTCQLLLCVLQELHAFHTRLACPTRGACVGVSRHVPAALLGARRCCTAGANIGLALPGVAVAPKHGDVARGRSHAAAKRSACRLRSSAPSQRVQCNVLSCAPPLRPPLLHQLRAVLRPLLRPAWQLAAAGLLRDDVLHSWPCDDGPRCAEPAQLRCPRVRRDRARSPLPRKEGAHGRFEKLGKASAERHLRSAMLLLESSPHLLGGGVGAGGAGAAAWQTADGAQPFGYQNLLQELLLALVGFASDVFDTVHQPGSVQQQCAGHVSFLDAPGVPTSTQTPPRSRGACAEPCSRPCPTRTAATCLSRTIWRGSSRPTGAGPRPGPAGAPSDTLNTHAAHTRCDRDRERERGGPGVWVTPAHGLARRRAQGAHQRAAPPGLPLPCRGRLCASRAQQRPRQHGRRRPRRRRRGTWRPADGRRRRRRVHVPAGAGGGAGRCGRGRSQGCASQTETARTWCAATHAPMRQLPSHQPRVKINTTEQAVTSCAWNNEAGAAARPEVRLTCPPPEPPGVRVCAHGVPLHRCVQRHCSCTSRRCRRRSCSCRTPPRASRCRTCTTSCTTSRSVELCSSPAFWNARPPSHPVAASRCVVATTSPDPRPVASSLAAPSLPSTP